MRSFSGSLEHVLDAKMRDRAEPPSPRLGRVGVGLTTKNHFLPGHQKWGGGRWG